MSPWRRRWRRLRRATLLGGALLISALDRASAQWMALELPEQLYNLIGTPLWDSSELLSQSSALGTLLHGLVGYDAQPAGMQIVFYVLVIVAISAGMAWVKRRAAAPKMATANR